MFQQEGYCVTKEAKESPLCVATEGQDIKSPIITHRKHAQASPPSRDAIHVGCISLII